jgi:hypothetical protein
MKTSRKIIGTIAAVVLSALSAIGQTNDVKVTANANVGVVSRNYLLSGAQQGEGAILQQGVGVNLETKLGTVSLSEASNSDDEFHEVDGRVAYSAPSTLSKTIKPTIAYEHKAFPDTDKSIDVIDVGVKYVHPALPVVPSALVRNLLADKDNGAGTLYAAGVASKPIPLATIGGVKLSTTANAQVVYMSDWMNTDGFSHAVGGASLDASYKNVTFSINYKHQEGIMDVKPTGDAVGVQIGIKL